MKTIHVGCYRSDPRRDQVINFTQVLTRVSTGDAQTRPEYSIELSGGNAGATIFAASENAFKRIKNIFAKCDSKDRITPGVDVIAIHIHVPPRGWPNQTTGSTTVRRAPEFVICKSPASFPGKPSKKFPYRTKPGIEVISLAPNPVVQFGQFHPDDSITIHRQTVTIVFGQSRSDLSALSVVTSDTRVSASLAASFVRKTPCRLMVNQAVKKISLVLTSGTKINLGGVA